MIRALRLASMIWFHALVGAIATVFGGAVSALLTLQGEIEHRAGLVRMAQVKARESASAKAVRAEKKSDATLN